MNNRKVKQKKKKKICTTKNYFQQNKLKWKYTNNKYGASFLSILNFIIFKLLLSDV